MEEGRGAGIDADRSGGGGEAAEEQEGKAGLAAEGGGKAEEEEGGWEGRLPLQLGGEVVMTRGGREVRGCSLAGRDPQLVGRREQRLRGLVREASALRQEGWEVRADECRSGEEEAKTYHCEEEQPTRSNEGGLEEQAGWRGEEEGRGQEWEGEEPSRRNDFLISISE